MSRKDALLAAVLEGALILTAALMGWALHEPLIFASLGPTAFELIETPKRKSARFYNILVGNLIAILAGFFALWVTHAWWAPAISLTGVPFPRVGAVFLAAALTVLGTLLANATQPAALSTTLIIATGVMQAKLDGLVIMAAVALILALGEPIRRWRARSMPDPQGR
ncbi:MAG TPA: HPP family protein [Acidobacteriaceae bacterium]|nr:HPP family protein [Acidobacteriaceae bacterium]